MRIDILVLVRGVYNKNRSFGKTAHHQYEALPLLLSQLIFLVSKLPDKIISLISTALQAVILMLSQKTGALLKNKLFLSSIHIASKS